MRRAAGEQSKATVAATSSGSTNVPRSVLASAASCTPAGNDAVIGVRTHPGFFWLSHPKLRRRYRRRLARRGGSAPEVSPFARRLIAEKHQFRKEPNYPLSPFSEEVRSMTKGA